MEESKISDIGDLDATGLHRFSYLSPACLATHEAGRKDGTKSDPIPMKQE